MYSKGQPPKVYNFTTYGAKGHTTDRCWPVIGYSKSHSQYKGPGATPLQIWDLLEASFQKTTGNKSLELLM